MTDLTPYAGLWVAIVAGQVVSVGHTVAEAQKKAEQKRPDEPVVLRYVDVPGDEPLPFSPLQDRIRPILAEEYGPVYLVGGAVRDALLGRISHDLDYVVPRKAIRLAFRVADAIGAPAYKLDEQRDTGRVVLLEQGTTLDFACFRGPDLVADLHDRDFTINAMAIPATARSRSAIIDPTGGLDDLAAKKIRQTQQNALMNDPVRALRAVRLAHQLSFEIADDTRESITLAAPLLEETSAERVRDELLKIFVGPRPGQALLDLQALDLLPLIMPEIAALDQIDQSPPHHENVLAHTASTLQWLVVVESAIYNDDRESARNLPDLAANLKPFQESLLAYWQRPIDGMLDGLVVLRLGALFHDVGKKTTYALDENGQIRFYNHALGGAEQAAYRLRKLCLSKEAISQVARIVSGHMRPLMLLQSQGADLSRRAVFRFFRATKVNGIDICLLALADHLATYNGPGSRDQWETLQRLVITLFHYYFERAEETVAPKPLLNGRDLIQQLGLDPGPEIGRILHILEENQAAGVINTREEALQFARGQISG